MVKQRHSLKQSDGTSSGSVTSDLAGRIKRARGQEAGAHAPTSNAGTRDMSGMARAARLGTEFIAAILVSAGIGYLADLWLGTTPWLMLLMLLVGFGAGVLNVVRAAAQMNAANPPPVGADLGPDDEDDE